MCTVLVRLDPDGAWPLLVAFVRDEARGRPTSAPNAWWPKLPTVVGGRDEVAGGTWLALDTQRPPALALLLDQFDPSATLPDPATSPTRGTLPLLTLERGPLFDLEADAPGGVDRYQPFHLVSITSDRGAWNAERWGWDGSALDHEEIAPGDHVIASRAPTLEGEASRRARLRAELARLPAIDPAPHLDPADAWGPWLDLLDGRATSPDDLDALTVHSVRQRPGFGTVGASLVAFAADGRVRYDVNQTQMLDPAAWDNVRPDGTGR